MENTMKLYVGNLPPHFTDADLENLVVDFGLVQGSGKMIIDRETGRSKGFGFVQVDSRENGEKAINTLNKSVVGRAAITVSEARPQEKREGGARPPFRKSFNNGPRGGDRGERSSFSRDRY